MIPSETLRFSIIVIHRNGERRLDEVLSSITHAMDDTQDEIIVVDNASNDGSLEAVMARHLNVQVIRNDCNGGYARACNQGMNAGRGRYFLLCNNDLRLPSETLSHFESDFLTFPKAGLIGGQLFNEAGKLQRSCGGSPNFWSEMGLLRTRSQPTNTHHAEPVESLLGACMAVRRSAVEMAGQMDEDFFFYFEEGEWCVRMRRHGWVVLFDPRVRIMHTGGGSTQQWYLESRVEFFRSRLLYYRRTMNSIQRVVLYAWRGVHLLWGAFSYGLLVILTLGCMPRLRRKLNERLLLLAWIAYACPDSWGLPNKCPASQR